jgi:hypothetical protein
MEPVERRHEPKVPRNRPKKTIEKKLKNGKKSMQRYIRGGGEICALRNNQLIYAYFALSLLARTQKRAAGKKKRASQSEMQLSSTKNVQEDSPEEISQKYQRVFQAKSSGLKVSKREQKAAPQLR